MLYEVITLRTVWHAADQRRRYQLAPAELCDSKDARAAVLELDRYDLAADPA